MKTRRRAYFFPHPLKPAEQPGRAGFAVKGTLLSPDGPQSSSGFRVFGDGYGENLLGENQDPCVFSSPLALVHAFCRIDAKGGKHYVQGSEPFSIAQVVQADDVVFYGSIKASKKRILQVFIDTVLVVAKTVEWPTERVRSGGKPYQLLTDASSLRVLSKRLNTAGDIRSSSVWRYCLSDAEAGHKYTAWQPHDVILGVAKPTTEGLRNAETSFVPVVPKSSINPLALFPSKSIESHFDLLAKRYPRLCGSMKPCVPLDWKFALELYWVTAGLSGPARGDSLVAVPPLTPLCV